MVQTIRGHTSTRFVDPADRLALMPTEPSQGEIVPISTVVLEQRVNER